MAIFKGNENEEAYVGEKTLGRYNKKFWKWRFQALLVFFGKYIVLLKLKREECLGTHSYL